MNRTFKMFNQFAGDDTAKSLIQKALTTASGSGGALIRQNLEALITSLVVKLSPELALVVGKSITGNVHEFNRLTALPTPGGAVGEGSTTPRKQASYVRDSVTLKVVRRIGEITNFLVDSVEEDVAAQDLENHVLAQIYDLVYYIVYGNADANTYEFSGLDHFIKTNRVNSAAAGTVFALTDLDDAIAKSNRKGGAKHRRAFIMSPELLSKANSLVTYFRLTQPNTPGIEAIEINGGWKLQAYRGIPIIESTYTRPLGTMGTVTPSAVVGGGSLAATTYFGRVAPVTLDGEQQASAQFTQIIASAETLRLTFTAFTGALSYKVYLGTTTGTANTKFWKQVSAFTYDGTGAVTGNVTVIDLTAAAPAADVPTEMQLDLPFVNGTTNPEEIFYLWDLDEIQGLGKFPYTNKAGDRMNGIISVKPLAETDDNIPWLIRTYGALTPSYEATSVLYRGRKVA